MSIRYGLGALALMALALTAVSVAAQSDTGKMPAGSWVAKPNTAISLLWSLVEREKGWATGTRTVAQGDGRRVLMTSFKISGAAWRCFQNFDRTGHATGTRCYRFEPR